jgi:hypothetical protein
MTERIQDAEPSFRNDVDPEITNQFDPRDYLLPITGSDSHRFRNGEHALHVRITVSLSPALAYYVRRSAQNAGISSSALVNKAVEEYRREIIDEEIIKAFSEEAGNI